MSQFNIYSYIICLYHKSNAYLWMNLPLLYSNRRMSALKLLAYLGLLLVLSCLSGAEEQKCSTSAHNCDECIQSGPACAWCSAPNANIRCDTLKGLQRAGCHKSYVFNPRGRVQVVKNDSG